MPCFHFRNHAQNNPLIRKHVTYLIKKHLNTHSIYYSILFLNEKSFWNLSSLLHNLTYLSLLKSFLLFFLITSLFLQNLSIIINYTKWSPNLFFFASSCFPRFSWARFFRVHVFLGLDTGTKVQFFKSSRCKATLLNSHFCMGVLLQLCCIFSELFLIRSP